MDDVKLLDFGPIEDKMQGIIKVIGVGGGGCNAVRNMNDEHIPGVTFAVCNTDSKSLAPSPVPVKILLGEGLGAGGKPEVGRSEAEKALRWFSLQRAWVVARELDLRLWWPVWQKEWEC